MWTGPRAAADAFAAESRAVQLRAGEGLPGRVWAAQEPAWVADVAVESGFPRAAAAAAAGLRSGFAFPVRGTTGLLGVIEFFVSERRELDDDICSTR